MLTFLGDSEIVIPLANRKEHWRQLRSACETKLLALMNSDPLMLAPLEASNCDVRNLLRTANEQTVAACVMEKLYLASDSLVAFRLSLLAPSPSESIFI